MNQHEIFSEQEIKERKKQAEERFKETHHDFLKDREEVDRYTFLMMHDDKIPDLGHEFLVWELLREKIYWTSLSKLNQLRKRGVINDYFSEQDLEKLAETMIEQVMLGEKIASYVPLFSDIFLLFSDEEKSPLVRFVREEHKVSAVNKGFWHCLNETKYENPNSDPRFLTESSNQGYASREINNLFKCDGFFNYFDFRGGVEKAVETPDDLCFRSLNLDSYMRWFLVQETEIHRKLEREKATEVRGKLVAPLVYELFTQGNWSEKEGLRRLAMFFVNGEIIKTAPMQRILGRVFELNLMGAFDNYEYSDYDSKTIKNCEELLLDSEKHIGACWERISSKRNFDISRLKGIAKEYVPKYVYKDMVEKLKQEMVGMKKFDLELFRRWITSEEVKRFVPIEVGRVRNKALEVYFSQRPRPKVSDSEGLARTVGTGEFGSDYLGDKVRGYVFMDLVAKKKWRTANNILMIYDIGRYFGNFGFATPKATRIFKDSLREYAERHEKVKVDKKGLDSRACYLHYNKIKDVVESLEGVFEVR